MSSFIILSMIESNLSICSFFKHIFLLEFAFILLPSIQIRFKSTRLFSEANSTVSLNASLTKEELFFLNRAIVLKFGWTFSAKYIKTKFSLQALANLLDDLSLDSIP